MPETTQENPQYKKKKNLYYLVTKIFTDIFFPRLDNAKKTLKKNP